MNILVYILSDFSKKKSQKRVFGSFLKANFIAQGECGPPLWGYRLPPPPHSFDTLPPPPLTGSSAGVMCMFEPPLTGEQRVVRHMVPTKLGLAIIDGFRCIDEEIVHPTIRSGIEREVARIAMGVSSLL